MRYIETDSETFWQIIQWVEGFELALNNQEEKGYLKGIPIYIKNERSSNNDK